MFPQSHLSSLVTILQRQEVWPCFHHRRSFSWPKPVDPHAMHGGRHFRVLTIHSHTTDAAGSCRRRRAWWWCWDSIVRAWHYISFVRYAQVVHSHRTQELIKMSGEKRLEGMPWRWTNTWLEWTEREWKLRDFFFLGGRHRVWIWGACVDKWLFHSSHKP